MQLKITEHHYTQQVDNENIQKQEKFTENFSYILQNSVNEILMLSEKLHKKPDEISMIDMYNAGILDQIPELAQVIRKNIYESEKVELIKKVQMHISDLQNNL